LTAEQPQRVLDALATGRLRLMADLCKRHRWAGALGSYWEGRPTGDAHALLSAAYCSPLLDQGVKPVNVAKLMGHKDEITTLRFYSHALPDDDMSYIARLTAARQAVGELNGDSV